MTGARDESQYAERRRDHELREMVNNLLGDVRDLDGQMHVIDNDGVEAAQRRFIKYADMIWERLLEGEKPEA